MAFSDGAVTEVKEDEVDPRDWIVLRGFSYRGKSDTFYVEEGQHTDFASVPRAFVWFLPRYGRYTKAAILHDHLWRDLASKEKLAYLDADGTFRRAMRELEVPFLTRWIMWAAVRLGALTKPRGLKGWWREAPRVLLLFAIAAPFIIPPAVVILISLAAFTLLEAIVWIPLKVASSVRERRFGRPAKKVNAPKFSWRL